MCDLKENVRVSEQPLCDNSSAEISGLAGITWTRFTEVRRERTLKRPSVHRFATTMLSACCATMSVLLKKKKLLDMDSSRGYETGEVKQ